MNQLETDILNLHLQAVSKAPSLAINICVGSYGRTAQDHHTFVIMRKQTGGGRGIWEKDHLAEVNTLREALSFTGATPYGSSTLCSECKQLPNID